MKLQELRCAKCAKPLAVADRACMSCGTEVPMELRLGVLLAKAEQQAEDGLYAEAGRSLEAALKEFPSAQGDKLLWRKRGAWLLRSGRPELLDAAESSLAESLRLDDDDDLSHQVWMDLLGRRGQLEKARAWYKQRLETRPEDAMAKRQLAILRLSSDFMAAPLPKLDLPPESEGALIKLFKPTPYKAGLAGLSTLFSLAQLFWALSSGGSQLADQPELAGVGQMLNDPWMPGIMALLGAAYLYWAWKELRG